MVSKIKQSFPKVTFYCGDHRTSQFQAKEATEFLTKKHQTH